MVLRRESFFYFLPRLIAPKDRYLEFETTGSKFSVLFVVVVYE